MAEKWMAEKSMRSRSNKAFIAFYFSAIHFSANSPSFSLRTTLFIYRVNIFDGLHLAEQDGYFFL